MAKTYVWGVTPASRAALRCLGHTVVTEARELGGFFAFGPMVRNSALNWPQCFAEALNFRTHYCRSGILPTVAMFGRPSPGHRALFFELLEVWRSYMHQYEGRKLHALFTKLLSVLAQINWRVEFPPMIVDHDGLVWNVLAMPPEALRRRVEQAWLRFVGLAHNHRSTMKDLKGIDRRPSLLNSRFVLLERDPDTGFAGRGFHLRGLTCQV